MADVAANYEQEHVAFHEAGHAVIGRILNLPCGYVTVVADDDSSGHGIVGDTWDIVARWENQGVFRDEAVALRARILTFMAGRVAEEECLGSCDEGSDEEDVRQVHFMLDSLLPADANPVAYRHRLMRRLRPMVRRHRATIARVAAELLKSGTLDAEEVDALVAGCDQCSAAIRAALEAAGIEFIPENGGGPGVRLRGKELPPR
jgi:ATP-dependent Zn protease